MKFCNMFSVFLDQQLNCKEISSAAEVFAKTNTFRGQEGLANISDGIIPTFNLGQYATYKHFYLWSKVKQKTIIKYSYALMGVCSIQGIVLNNLLLRFHSKLHRHWLPKRYVITQIQTEQVISSSPDVPEYSSNRELM